VKAIRETKKASIFQNKVAPVSFQFALSGANAERLMKSVCGSFTYLQ
jgi:hypothetical protein